MVNRAGITPNQTDKKDVAEVVHPTEHDESDDLESAKRIHRPILSVADLKERTMATYKG